MKVIEVPVDKIVGGFPEHAKTWWNWQHYFDTWRMYDKNPNAPFNQYPLYAVWRKLFDASHPTKEVMKKAFTLYTSMKTEGYIPEKSKDNPMTVEILRNGVIRLYNGHHRLSIMKYLGQPKTVKVVVKIRTKDWVDFKNTAFILYNKKQLYQPIDHPDFADWSVVHDSQDRLNAMLDYYGDVNGKHIFDIGSCTGWFSHELAKRGAVVIGTEINSDRLRISRSLSIYHGLDKDNPLFINRDFRNYLDKNKQRFDAVIYLNLLHHYLKKDLTAGWNTVDLISKRTDTMFLGIGQHNLLVKPEQIPQKIIDNSQFTRYEQLLTTSDNRPLYVFEKEGAI